MRIRVYEVYQDIVGDTICEFEVAKSDRQRDPIELIVEKLNKQFSVEIKTALYSASIDMKSLKPIYEAIVFTDSNLPFRKVTWIIL